MLAIGSPRYLGAARRRPSLQRQALAYNPEPPRKPPHEPRAPPRPLRSLRPFPFALLATTQATASAQIQTKL